MKIGIQGVRASFHDAAAREFFKNETIELCECSSFPRLCEALANLEADFCVMAIENSIAGGILPNYLLLEKYQFKIIGEFYLPIEMNFMALPGQKMGDLEFVQSHPMALLQCQEFLLKYSHLKVIEFADTAEAAKDISQKKLKGYAAIAPRLAAEVYGLEILQSGIQSNNQNYTRFLLISRDQIQLLNEPARKASIRFEVSHNPGSLLAFLSIFYTHGINLTHLQSVPVLGKPSQFAFHVDLEWEDDRKYQKALVEIKKSAINLIHFGEYPKSERPKV